MKKNHLLLIAFIVTGIIRSQVNSWQQTSTPPGGSIWGLTTINGSVFAAASNGGVYFSPDQGATWTVRNGTLSQVSARSIIADGNDLYLGTDGSFSSGLLFKSSDYGLTWTNITPASMNPTGKIHSLLIVNGDLYAAAYGGNGIFKSPLNNISSSTWSNFSNGLANQGLNVNSLAAVGNDLIAGTYGLGVWRSPQSNANWVATNGNAGTHIRAVGAHDTIAFAGTISGNTYFSRSADGGLNWTASNSSYFNNKYIYSIINQGNNIFVGIEYEGIRMSNDNGVNWGTYNDGFQDSLNNWYCNHLNVRSMAFSGSIMYAGTDCGVWKTICAAKTIHRECI